MFSEENRETVTGGSAVTGASCEHLCPSLLLLPPHSHIALATLPQPAAPSNCHTAQAGVISGAWQQLCSHARFHQQRLSLTAVQLLWSRHIRFLKQISFHVRALHGFVVPETRNGKMKGRGSTCLICRSCVDW